MLIVATRHVPNFQNSMTLLLASATNAVSADGTVKEKHLAEAYGLLQPNHLRKTVRSNVLICVSYSLFLLKTDCCVTRTCILA